MSAQAQLCTAQAAWVSLPWGCPGPGRRGTAAAPCTVTSLAQLFPAVLRTWSWGNPNLLILLAFTRKLVAERARDADNGCVIKRGSHNIPCGLTTPT